MVSTRLEKLGIRFPFMVAPMVGVSHVAFRELVRSYTPRGLESLIFTEMLSTRRIPSEHLEEAESLRCSPQESFFIPQLLGNEEKFIAPSIEKLMRASPWGFDINMGCPAKKTLSHNWGVRLMGDKDYAGEVVRITKRHSSLPVSVKLRAGIERDLDIPYLADFTERLEDAGADWITLHCRAREQRHRGRADWNVVGQITKLRSIPVVANGDIQCASDAIGVIKEYGADGAMIARAAMARPWILWQISHSLGGTAVPEGYQPGEIPPMTPEEEGKEYFLAVLRFISLLDSHYGENKKNLVRFKAFVGHSHRWLNFGHHFWKSVVTVQSLAEAKEKVIVYREQYPQTMANRINL